MKGRQIKHIVHRQYKKLHKYAQRMKDLDEESLHQFRVAYKKLRAVLKMVVAPGKEAIPEKLKKMYQIAGAIRDLQLQQKQLTGSNKDALIIIPSYQHWLQQKVIQLTPGLKKNISTNFFEACQKKTNAVLPEKFSAADHKKYEQQKWLAIRTLHATANLTDAVIHTIRKRLKESFFTKQLFKSFKKDDQQKTGEDKKYFSTLLTNMGSYQDRCTAITLLNIFITEKPGIAGLEKLQQIKKQFVKEKAVMKRSLTKQLRELLETPGTE